MSKITRRSFINRVGIIITCLILPLPKLKDKNDISLWKSITTGNPNCIYFYGYKTAAPRLVRFHADGLG